MHLVAAFASLLLTTAAGADESWDIVSHQQGWVVRTSGNWCQILNRDPSEFVAAPYNGLSFVRSAGSSRTEIRAYFWPGAFADNKPVILTVEPRGAAQPFEYTAMTTGDYIVDPDHEISKEDLDRIIEAGWIVVEASEVGPTLAFDTHALAAPLAELEKCAASLKGG